MLFLLDNGHGALINGKYVTPGKRSPKWSNGSQLFEGEFNRAIVARIIESLTTIGIPYVNITPETRDVSLRTRVNRANKYSAVNSIFISIHSNAGGGRGSEFYTSKGNTRSDLFATFFGEEFQNEFPNEEIRCDWRDGDLDKENNFFVLRRTKMPAILTESFFMDNYRECSQFLLTSEGRDRIAQYHIRAIERIHQMTL